jgi:integrase
MESQTLKLLKAAPVLAMGAMITLAEAEAHGVGLTQILRVVAEGRLKLYCRLAGVPGHLVSPTDLPDDPLTGVKELPAPKFMPQAAVESAQTGVFQIPDSKQVANAMLADQGDGCVEIVAVAINEGRWFIPERVQRVPITLLEVRAKGVDTIRQFLVDRLPRELIERELAAYGVPLGVASRTVGRGPRADALFTAAVEAYCSDPHGLAQRVASAIEIRQRKNTLLLFSEFMGDMPLYEITSDVLRAYRDGPLKKIPANANRLPKSLQRDTMTERIRAIADAGIDWPALSLDEQQKRMAQLAQLFAWLKKKEWTDFDPALAIAGETGMTKAQLKDEKRRRSARKSGEDDEVGRPPFSDEEVRLIFDQPQYKTGDGSHITKGNVVWYPFEYWLPLLGLYGGCRIGEVSQLHLADVRKVRSVWVLDLREDTIDKKLKNDVASVRQIPIHPVVIEKGFLAYCDALRLAGFKRVFPELSYSTTDARYAKESIRKMSAMLKRLGMPRDNTKVFHCLRHNINDKLARVPMTALPFADENLRKYIRYKIMGHQQADDVNVQSYSSSSIEEAASLLNAVSYVLPPLANFNVEAGVIAVQQALAKKKGDRRGREDMGPAGNDSSKAKS